MRRVLIVAVLIAVLAGVVSAYSGSWLRKMTTSQFYSFAPGWTHVTPVIDDDTLVVVFYNTNSGSFVAVRFFDFHEAR